MKEQKNVISSSHGVGNTLSLDACKPKLRINRPANSNGSFGSKTPTNLEETFSTGRGIHQLELISDQTELSIDSTKKEVGNRKVAFGEDARDEMNLAEFPLAVLSSRTNPGIKTLEFTDTQRLKTGEVVERKWIITGADKFGLPTSTDDDVVLGLMQLTKDQGFSNRKVVFTRYELLKALRWSTEGRSYLRLTKSLDRLSGVRIRATNAFYDNSTKAYQTVNFGLIDAYEINDSRGSHHGQETTKSFFIWSEKLFDSFKAGFIKKLDLDVYFSLKSSVSRRMYRYLDKHTHYRSSVEKHLLTFAFEKLGLSRSYKYVSSVKQQIEPAAKELVEIGFLKDFEFFGRGQDTYVRFTVKSKELPNSITLKSENHQNFSSQHPTTDVADELTKKLLERGMNTRQVEFLLKGKEPHEYERIRKIVDHFDSLVATKSILAARNPIGFLYRAVERPYAFTLPGDSAESQINKSGHQKASSLVQRSRPELRVLNQRKVPTDSQKTTQPSALDGQSIDFAAYELFLERELLAAKNSLMDPELQEMRVRIEQRMSCLRSVLTAERFQQSIQAGIDEELRRKSGIPDFKSWQRLLMKDTHR